MREHKVRVRKVEFFFHAAGVDIKTMWITDDGWGETQKESKQKQTLFPMWYNQSSQHQWHQYDIPISVILNLLRWPGHQASVYNAYDTFLWQCVVCCHLWMRHISRLWPANLLWRSMCCCFFFFASFYSFIRLFHKLT